MKVITKKPMFFVSIVLAKDTLSFSMLILIKFVLYSLVGEWKKGVRIVKIFENIFVIWMEREKITFGDYNNYSHNKFLYCLQLFLKFENFHLCFLVFIVLSLYLKWMVFHMQLCLHLFNRFLPLKFSKWYNFL